VGGVFGAIVDTDLEINGAPATPRTAIERYHIVLPYSHRAEPAQSVNNLARMAHHDRLAVALERAANKTLPG
jgi:hypothetical protein